MKVSDLIKKLQARQEKYGDIEVKQLMGVTNSLFGGIIGEKLVSIKKVKYHKRSNTIFVDFY